MASDSYIHRSEKGAPSGQFPAAPLLFAFHGTGADETQFLDLGRRLMPRATVVAPRGDVSEHGAARFFRRTGEGVYDMDDLARATRKMAGFVAAHRAAAKPSCVVGLGYSNGANILASVLFAAPGLFDAAVLMHPLIPFEPQDRGRLDAAHVLVTAGRRDPICPPDLTERLVASLRRRGARTDLFWHDGGHEIRQGEIMAAQAFLDRPYLDRIAEEKPMETAMNDNFHIEFEDNGHKGRYVVRGADGAEAELTFTSAGDSRIIIDHTGVPDAFRGQGVGAKLVARAVEDARAAGKTVLPLCPFAAAQFKRHPDWADVLAR